MAQSPRIIDITKTYTPIDPQNVEHNRIGDAADSMANRSETVIAYEGYNFLPTAVGYKSYFGTNNKFIIPPCPAGVRVDRVFIFQDGNLKNYFVALAEDGIYINDGKDSTLWTKLVVLEVPAPGAHFNWSIAVLNNWVYMYRAGAAAYYKLSLDYAVKGLQTVVPSFLNMAGQVGIFKAGGRLGFWDTANSVAWSSFDDHQDFTPSIVTLAGSAIFLEVRGNIVSVLACGDGFIIYATNSVVFVARDLANTFQWNPSVLMSGSGIAYQGQVVVSSPDTTHFAYTGIGLHEVSGAKMEPIATIVTDLLRESADPVLITLLENRYLCLQLIDQKMVDGLVELDSKTYDSAPISDTSKLEEIMKLVPIDELDNLEELP